MTRAGVLHSFFICRVATYALLCFSLYVLLPGGFTCIEAANDNNQYNVGDDHYVGHVDVEMNFDGYGEDPSRKHPPGLNPSQQEQILKSLAWLLRTSGDREDEAISLFERLLELQGENEDTTDATETTRVLAEMLTERGEVEEAKKLSGSLAFKIKMETNSRNS